MTNSRFTPGIILVKNSFINLIGMVVPLLIGIAAVPFAIKGLGKEGFGILSVAWVIMSYMILLDLGLRRATIKFTAEYLHRQKFEKIAEIMWTAALLGLGFGLLGGTTLYFLAPFLSTSLLNIPVHLQGETIQSIQYIAFALPLLLVSISLKGMLAAAQRFDLINAIQIPVNTINFIIPAMTFYLGFNLSTVILFILVFRIIAGCIYFYLCGRVYPGCWSIPRLFHSKMYKNMLTFGGWVTITSLISPILVYADRFFIGSILPIGMLTFYAAPQEAITRLRIIPTAIMNTLFPEFSKTEKEIPQEYILKLLKKSLNMILLFTGILTIILFFSAKDLLTLWLGIEFALKSTIIVKLFSIGILLNFMALVPFTYLQGSGRPDLPAKCHLAELPLYIIILLFFLHKFGITGAAYAWCLRVMMDAILLFSLTFRSLPGLLKNYLSDLFRRIIALLIVFAVSLSAVQIFIDILLARILVSTVLSTAICLAAYFMILTEADRNLILSIFKKRIPYEPK